MMPVTFVLPTSRKSGNIQLRADVARPAPEAPLSEHDVREFRRPLRGLGFGYHAPSGAVVPPLLGPSLLRSFLYPMSVKQITAAWDLEMDSHAEKLVLIALADNANDEGECWPSIATLARKCDMTPNGVKNVIKRLAKKELVAVNRRKRNNGSDASNFYVLNLKCRGNGVTP